MYIANIYSGNWPEVPVRHENTLMSRNSLLIRENMTPCQRQRQTETRRKQNESRRTGGCFSASTSTVCVATAAEFFVTEEEDLSGFVHTQLLSWDLLLNVDKSDTYTRLKS